MADKTKTKNDEFFQLLAEPQGSTSSKVVKNPFSEDEIIFKDEQGQIKILKASQVVDLLPKSQSRQPRTSTPPTKPPSVDVIVKAATTRQAVLEKTAESIISQYKFKETFSEPALEKRFKNVVISCLKGVRNKVETREMLTKSTSNGGMGFENQTAEKILNLIEKEIDHSAKTAVLASPEGTEKLSPEGQELLNQPKIDSPPELVFTDPIQKSKLQTTVETAPLPIVEELPGVEPAPVVPSPEEVPISRKPILTPSDRPKIEDVKFKPKSVGPIDEIQTLTLEDFRRLSDDPQEAAERIMEKIELLEQESFSHKIKAIKAWQQSEVNRLYLELGEASMEEKKPVADIINQRRSNNQPSLNEDEFEAVSDLNQKLRH